MHLRVRISPPDSNTAGQAALGQWYQNRGPNSTEKSLVGIGMLS